MRAQAAVLPLLLLVLPGSAASARAATPLPKWSWDTLQTFTYGTNTSCCPDDPACCSGIDSPDELRFKMQYDVVFIDNELAAPGCRNVDGTSNWTKCNDFKAARAADIKATDPMKPVYVYRGGPFGCGGIDGGKAPPDPNYTWYDYLTNATFTLADTWLVDMHGEVNAGVCDFRKVAAQNYWLTQMVFGPGRRWLTDAAVDGMFSDSGLIMGWQGDRLNITVGTRRELFNATCGTMRKMAEGLAAHGKRLTFSLKDHFSGVGRTGGGTSGGTLCDPTADPSLPVAGRRCFPYGEEVLYEIMRGVEWIPFREYNIPSRDFGKDNATAQKWGCAAAIVDHAEEARRGPVFACNNDGAPNATVFPSPFGNLSWLEQHQMSLAAHMLGMEEGSYFGSGMHWTDEGWRWRWPEMDRPLGRPLGPYTRDGFRFRRSFEHVDVFADCETLQARLDWRAPPAPPRAGRISVARTNGVAVGVRDVVLFAGGYTDTAGKAKSDVVDIYNTTSGAWSAARMSTGRTLFAGAGLGALAMFGCGETGSVQSESDTVDMWDAGTRRWSVERLSQARKKCSATAVALETGPGGEAVRGKIVFAGGWPLGGHHPTAAVDIFDIQTRTWTVANLSLPRMYMSAASVGPYAIFAGGLADGGNSDRVDVWNAETGEWATATLVSPMREGNAVSTYRHAIFYGGGHSQLFDPRTGAWTVRNHSAEWAKMATASIGGGRFAVFAGGIGCPGNVCAAVEVYDEKESRWFAAARNLSVAREYLMGAGAGGVAVFAGGSDRGKNSTAATDFFAAQDLLAAA